MDLKFYIKKEDDKANTIVMELLSTSSDLLKSSIPINQSIKVERNSCISTLIFVICRDISVLILIAFDMKVRNLVCTGFVGLVYESLV